MASQDRSYIEPTALETAVSADPIWSASLYCSGWIDQGIEVCLLPILRDVGSSGNVWWLRYAKGGEHLKIRFHTSNPDRSIAAKSRFTSLAERFLAELPPTPEPAPAKKTGLVPSIDAEDEQAFGPPRRLVFTTYRRSSVSFGPAPFLHDDRIIRRMVAALAAGCRYIAARWPSQMTAGRRRRIHVEMLVEGLASLDLAAETLAAYLTYHRDWLIRGILLGKTLLEASWLAELDRRVEASGLIELLGPSLVDRSLQRTANPWTATLQRLYREVEAAHPAERLDPFARQASFTPLFKVLHGTANALGQGRPAEAFVYHLLWRLTQLAGPERAVVRDRRS